MCCRKVITAHHLQVQFLAVLVLRFFYPRCGQSYWADIVHGVNVPWSHATHTGRGRRHREKPQARSGGSQQPCHWHTQAAPAPIGHSSPSHMLLKPYASDLATVSLLPQPPQSEPSEAHAECVQVWSFNPFPSTPSSPGARQPCNSPPRGTCLSYCPVKNITLLTKIIKLV